MEDQKGLALSADEIELGENVPQNADNGKWRDVGFAIAYYISLTFSLILGIYLITKIDDDNDEIETSDSLSFKFNLLQIFLCVLTGIIFTFLWLAIVVYFAECIIKTALIGTPIFLLIVGIISLFASPFLGIILILSAAFSAWYAYAVWNRVEFAVACLKIVIGVFKQFYSPLGVNIFMGFVSIILMVIDSMVFIGVANGISSSGLQFLVMFFLFVMIYWHNIVTINVAHVTACGVMGTWLYSDATDGVTKNSFKRAVTTSFGSICFGSLIEAVIRALSAMVRELERRNRENQVVLVLLCLLRCILNLIGDIVEYINSYAFVYVALYGDAYLQSAKNCWAMFQSRGIQALINDDLTTIPLWLGAIFNVGVIILVGFAIDGLNLNVLIAVIFGLVIYLCCVYTLISYIKTLFVCWMSDPATFSQQRPEEYRQIVEAANEFGYNTEWCQQDRQQKYHEPGPPKEQPYNV